MTWHFSVVCCYFHTSHFFHIFHTLIDIHQYYYYLYDLEGRLRGAATLLFIGIYCLTSNSFMIMQKSKYIFSGECFRRFLIRNRLTYLAAAKLLDLDKNTVGKVARGGNTSLAVLLRIANYFGIPVGEFFVKCESDDAGCCCEGAVLERVGDSKSPLIINKECTDEFSKRYRLNADVFIIDRLDRIVSRLDRMENRLREWHVLDDE